MFKVCIHTYVYKYVYQGLHYPFSVCKRVDVQNCLFSAAPGFRDNIQSVISLCIPFKPEYASRLTTTIIFNSEVTVCNRAVFYRTVE